MKFHVSTLPACNTPTGQIQIFPQLFQFTKDVYIHDLGRGIVSLSSRKVRIHSAHVGLEQSLLKDPAHVT